MMRRRFSNFPNPLQKKKLETYKKFITPTNYDPITYVQQHRKMRFFCFLLQNKPVIINVGT